MSTAQGSTPFANRAFAWLFASQAATQLGDWLRTIALIGIVYRLQPGFSPLAGLYLCSALPMLGSCFFPSNTRLNKKRLLLFGDVLHALLVLGMASGARAGHLWIVYACVAASALLQAACRPLRAAMVPGLVAVRHFKQASGCFGLLHQAAMLFGGGAAALLIGPAGATGLLLFDAGCAWASAVCLACMRQVPDDGEQGQRHVPNAEERGQPVVPNSGEQEQQRMMAAEEQGQLDAPNAEEQGQPDVPNAGEHGERRVPNAGDQMERPYSQWRMIRAGFAVVRSKPQLVGLFGAQVCRDVASAYVAVFFSLYLLRDLQAGMSGVGVGYAVTALGSGLGLYAFQRTYRKRAFDLKLHAPYLILYGILLGAMYRVHSVLLFFVLLLLSCVFLSGVNAMSEAALMVHAKAEARGSVVAAWLFLSRLAYALSLVLFAWAGDAVPITWVALLLVAAALAAQRKTTRS